MGFLAKFKHQNNYEHFKGYIKKPKQQCSRDTKSYFKKAADPCFLQTLNYTTTIKLSSACNAPHICQVDKSICKTTQKHIN